jgi:hypothetical protein
MMLKKPSISVIALIAIVGCATPIRHDTPSGRPEVTVRGNLAKPIHREITNAMLNRGYNVKSSTETLLVFERPLDNAMASVLLGSQYDSTPAARITYSIVESMDWTRVVASFAAVTNPGSAFERITPLNNNPDTAEYQALLNEIKVRLESGQ